METKTLNLKYSGLCGFCNGRLRGRPCLGFFLLCESVCGGPKSSKDAMVFLGLRVLVM